MTKKQMKEKAERLIKEGTFHSESGNETWKHLWYVLNGFLNCITYKNGKLEEVRSYGKIAA